MKLLILKIFFAAILIAMLFYPLLMIDTIRDMVGNEHER